MCFETGVQYQFIHALALLLCGVLLLLPIQPAAQRLSPYEKGVGIICFEVAACAAGFHWEVVRPHRLWWADVYIGLGLV